MVDGHALLYESTPLNPLSNEIRLLRILPGQDDQMVVCTLESVSLNDEPYYEALSYTWGDPVICRPVIVYSEIGQNNYILDVTTNLEAALRHLRFPKHSRAIWIDAICINQRDGDEKSRQIPLMRKIYTLATEVIVWLGELDQDSKVAMDHVRGLTFLLNPTQELLHAYDFIAHKQLSVFVRKSWWERAWILQEATVGKEPRFLCGKTYMSWWTFCRAADNLERMDPLMKRFMDTKAYYDIWKDPYDDFLTRIRKLGAIRQGFEAFQQLALLWLIYQTSGCKSTDPRDVIWSLHGLLSKETQNLVSPDYRSKSVSAAFEEVCIAILIESGNLDFLSFPSNRYACAPFTAPTWVPNFAGFHHSTSPSPLMQPVIDGPFRASGAMTLVAQISPGLLGLKGFVVDKIMKTLQYDLFNIEPESMAKLASSTMLRTSEGSTDPRRLLYQFESIWRVLIANISNESQYPAPEDCGERFSKIIDLVPRRLSSNEIEEHRLFISPYYSRLKRTTFGRSLYVTETGFLVLTDSQVRKGDVVVILYGGKLPYILRNVGGFHTFLGEAYTPGIMDGEMISLRKVFPNVRFWYPEKQFWLR